MEINLLKFEIRKHNEQLTQESDEFKIIKNELKYEKSINGVMSSIIEHKYVDNLDKESTKSTLKEFVNNVK